MTKRQWDKQEMENRGYHDGQLWAQLGKPMIYAHFDQHYLKGWQAGYQAYRDMHPIIELHHVRL